MGAISIKTKLSSEIQRGLRKRYGHIPSAAFVAREFNLRDHSAHSVTQEAVRRWIKGDSLPQPHRLTLIFEWLAIDPTKIWQTSLCGKAPSEILRPIFTEDELKIQKLCASLSPQHRKALLLFMQSYFTPPPPK